MTGLTEIFSRQNKRGICQPKHNYPKTDMTPMVDLGFLLITFFVITTQLSKPATIDLFMTKDGPPISLGRSDALTILMSKNNIIYYFQGDWEQAFNSNQIFQTSFSSNNGLRKLIQQKQNWLDSAQTKEGRKGLMLLIKADENAIYNDLVNVMDEILINDVKKYAIIGLSDGETRFLKSRNQENEEIDN